MDIVYSRKNFQVYKVENEFIVHNTNKIFKEGHSHLFGYESAKKVIDLAIHERVPNDLDRYRLVSLIRISENPDYKAKIQELIDAKDARHKKGENKYYNHTGKNYSNCGKRA